MNFKDTQLLNITPETAEAAEIVGDVAETVPAVGTVAVVVETVEVVVDSVTDSHRAEFSVVHDIR